MARARDRRAFDWQVAVAKRKDVVVAPPTIDWSQIPSALHEYPRNATIFAQGEPASSVHYLEKGAARLSVVSHAGKEAVVAILHPGQFFGEGCLAGQAVRIATAVAMSSCTVRVMHRQHVAERLHSRRVFADAFLSHMLNRNIRIEADLLDHLFNSTEKRLARTLLMLAHYGDAQGAERVIPKVSQELLAEMVGTTRTRVNFFMTKFKRLGYITYGGDITVRGSLLTILLQD